MTSTSASFLKNYQGEEKKVVGIPKFIMNRPFVTNGLGDVGLELEIEGRSLPTGGYLDRIRAPKSGAKWQAKADGSLRGEALEYVLTTPCYINEADYMLSELWRVFREMGTRFSLSNRCSTHVHVNQNARKVNEITAILALWSAFEEPLINWCGEERVNNHFCLSGKETAALIDTWNEFLRKGGNPARSLSDGYKYLALNVRPLFDIGSLEFRCMRASETYEPLLDWAKIVHGLCTFAADRYRNPFLLAADMSERGATQIFFELAESSGVSEGFVEQVLNLPENADFDRMVLRGFRRAQSITLQHPWYDWMEEVDKVYIPSPFGDKKVKMEEPMIRPRGMVDGFAPMPHWEPAPAPARPVRLPYDDGHEAPYPRYRIDPDLPIEFTNGAAAQVVRTQRPGVIVRATNHFFSGQRNLREEYSYDLDTGFWSGAPHVARIRNVGSLPIPGDDLGF